MDKRMSLRHTNFETEAATYEIEVVADVALNDENESHVTSMA